MPPFARAALGAAALLLAPDAPAQIAAPPPWPTAHGPGATHERWTLARAQERVDAELGFFDDGRPDSAPPVGVEGWRRLDRGHWLVSLRYGREEQDGLRDGRSDLSESELFAQGYTTLGTEMSTDTETLEVWYGIDSDWSVYARLPFVQKRMENVTSGGAEFTTRSSGLGDLVVGATRNVVENDGEVVRAQLGLGIPTGSVDERDADETGQDVLLPYAMQLGTGTFDLYPGVLHMVQFLTWSYGSQAVARLHLGLNDEDWAVSDSFHASGWIARRFDSSFSASLRLDGRWWGDYHGGAEELDPSENPLDSPNRQGGSRIDVLAGLRYDFAPDWSSTNRLDLEVGVPIDEWLDGPALATEWLLTLGWQLSF